ncbi:MAG: 50S ribosomal protein L10 [Synergistaceae bacterium]|jgi:large subunit ribosomal protein L10|nr:50S ribosomal protein L10 [Synergistaceae bacterium]
MPTEAKRKEIDELVKCVKASSAIYIVEYRGLTVSKSTAVRRAIRAVNGEMKITKNTLMRIALKESGLVTADEIDFGPNAYVFAYGEAAATARAIRDFAKEKGNEALVIKGGLLGERVISKEQVIALADLPSREALLSILLGTLNGPIRGFVTVLAGPARGLVTALSQIKEQKEKAA